MTVTVAPGQHIVLIGSVYNCGYSGAGGQVDIQIIVNGATFVAGSTFNLELLLPTGQTVQAYAAGPISSVDLQWCTDSPGATGSGFLQVFIVND